MPNLQITSIDLKIPKGTFEQELENYINAHSHPMTYTVQTLKTKMGKGIFKVHIDNGNSSFIDVVSEQDDISGDMLFHPFKLKNLNDSFYALKVDDDILGEDNDPSMFLSLVFEQMCIQHQGTYACIDSRGNTTLVREGSPKKRASLAIVDSDGTIYSCTNAKNIKGESDDIEFTVRKPIAEWLNENQEVQANIQKMNSQDKMMDYVGKYLIAAKYNDDIDAEEFIDIFRQAGVIGFSDQGVINIYKLLM